MPGPSDVGAIISRVQAAGRGRDGRLVVVGLVMITGMQWVVVGLPAAPAALGLAVLAVAVLAAAALLLLHDGRKVAASGLLLAVSPVVLSAAVSGNRLGAVAALLTIAGSAAAAVPTLSRLRWQLAPIVIGLAAIGLASWWQGSFDRRSATAPTWSAAWRATGESLRSALTSVGDDGAQLASGGLIVWAIAFGLLAGGALLAGLSGRVTVLVIGFGVIMVGAWVIDVWRGPEHPLGGVWALSAPMAWLAASIELGEDEERRFGAGLAAAVAVLSTVAQWSLVAHDGVARWTLPIAFVGGVCLLVGLTSLRVRLSAPSGAGPVVSP